MLLRNICWGLQHRWWDLERSGSSRSSGAREGSRSCQTTRRHSQARSHHPPSLVSLYVLCNFQLLASRFCYAGWFTVSVFVKFRVLNLRCLLRGFWCSIACRRCHYRDHAGGNDKIKQLVPGIKVYGGSIDNVKGCTDKVENGDKLHLGAHVNILCLHTPWYDCSTCSLLI